MPIAAIIQLGKLILTYGPSVINLISGLATSVSQIKDYIYRDKIMNEAIDAIGSNKTKAEKIAKLKELKCYADSCIIN